MSVSRKVGNAPRRNRTQFQVGALVFIAALIALAVILRSAQLAG